MQVNYAIKSDWELIDKFWLQQVWMNIKYFTQMTSEIWKVIFKIKKSSNLFDSFNTHILKIECF